MYLFILYHSPQAVKYCVKMSKIEINNVYKIFGSNPKSVLPMVKEGSSKEEILEKYWQNEIIRGEVIFLY